MIRYRNVVFTFQSNTLSEMCSAEENAKEGIKCCWLTSSRAISGWSSPHTISMRYRARYNSFRAVDSWPLAKQYRAKCICEETHIKHLGNTDKSFYFVVRQVRCFHFPKKYIGTMLKILTYSWMVLGCSMPSALSLMRTAFCWLLRAWQKQFITF